jgi:hypothetical protein
MAIESIRSVSPVGPSAPTVTSAPSASPEPGAFGKLVRSVGAELARGEKFVKAAEGAARSGETLGPGGLIALQVGVYRYSEMVEIATKVVEQATHGIKTVLQGQ